MKTKQDLLDRYDGPNQDTKREIIRYLYNNPDQEHDSESIFEAIQGDCRAGSAGTVANQLSEISKNHDQIKLETRSFYQWGAKVAAARIGGCKPR